MQQPINPAVIRALQQLKKAFDAYGTQWPMEYVAGHYDLNRADDAAAMLTRHPYYCATLLPDRTSVDMLAEHIAWAAEVSTSNVEIDGDDEDAGIEISSAIVDIGTALCLTFQG